MAVAAVTIDQQRSSLFKNCTMATNVADYIVRPGCSITANGTRGLLNDNSSNATYRRR